MEILKALGASIISFVAVAILLKHITRKEEVINDEQALGMFILTFLSAIGTFLFLFF